MIKGHWIAAEVVNYEPLYQVAALLLYTLLLYTLLLYILLLYTLIFYTLLLYIILLYTLIFYTLLRYTLLLYCFKLRDRSHNMSATEGGSQQISDFF